MMREKKLTHAASGFTLIEVILAISILAVMVTLNYQMLRGVVQAKELIEDRRDAMYIANSLLTRLSRELQLAYTDTNNPQARLFVCQTGPGMAPPAAPNPGPARFLIGESDDNGAAITFMAKGAGQQTADTSGKTGIVMINYKVDQDPDRRSQRDAPLVLTRTETPSSGALQRDCSKLIRFPVTTQLKSFSLRFYDARKKTWTNEWDGGTPGVPTLPHIIEFSVSLYSPQGNVITHTSAVRVSSMAL